MSLSCILKVLDLLVRHHLACRGLGGHSHSSLAICSSRLHRILSHLLVLVKCAVLNGL